MLHITPLPGSKNPSTILRPVTRRGGKHGSSQACAALHIHLHEINKLTHKKSEHKYTFKRAGIQYSTYSD